MQLENRRIDRSEEGILPLINVVFLLLIFFMLAGSLSAVEPLDIDPPQSASDSDAHPAALTILLSSNGELALDGGLLPEKELLKRVAQRIRVAPDTRVQLKADGATQGNRVVQLMEGLRRTGVERLQLLALQDAP